jgi:3-hydroxyisobutyrate dehydrogenase
MVELGSPTQERPAPVGVAGLGRMGTAMASRLLERGVPVVVWNRNPASIEPLVSRGAARAGSPAELTSASQVVLTSLLDDAALDAVFSGPEGLLKGHLQGKLFIDTSTVSPSTVVRIAEMSAAGGAAFVDAPVLGTVTPAREGRLIVMAGGTAENVARARATLNHIAAVIHHVGEVGSGVAMKMAVNVPMTAYWAAMADSFALARACKLDAKQLVESIAKSPAALAQLQLKMPVLLGESTQVGYDIRGVLKDCEVIRRLAASKHLALPMLEGAFAAFTTAEAGGWGDRDVAAVPRFQLLGENLQS